MEYKILYKDGRAKRAEMKTVHGTIPDACFHECRHGGGDQGRGFDR